jgi:hypothetical protein
MKHVKGSTVRVRVVAFALLALSGCGSAPDDLFSANTENPAAPAPIASSNETAIPAASSLGSPSASAVPTQNAPKSACTGKIANASSKIADFEQGIGGWYGYVGASGSAPVSAWPVVASAPGADSTAFAATFSGGPAAVSGIGFELPCMNVAAFDGISFWAKGRGGDAVRFLAVVPGSDPTVGVGDCDPSAMKCSDHPGVLFTLTPDWEVYSVAWNDLKQAGWGSQATFADVINAVLWINDGPVTSFDFSIDQVLLYRGDPRP